MKIRNVLFSILQCTWGIIQTFVGLICFTLSIKCKHYYYNGVIVTEWQLDKYVSLGLFVFISRNIANDKDLYERMRYHEFGHTIQSAFLGPLYPFIIMLPSFIWCGVPYFAGYRKRRKMSYYDFFPEKWADKLGKKHTRPRGTL